MTKFSKFMHVGAGATLAMAIVLTASTASADLGKCQKKISGIANKYNIAYSKGLLKCLDSIRKNGGEPKAADACEKALGKVIDAGNSVDITSTREKSVTKMQALDDGGVDAVCQPEDLQALGNLVPPAAPGGVNYIDWTTTWLLKAKEMLALKEVIFDVGDIRPLLDSIISIGADPVNCVGGEGDCGTDCTGTPPAGTIYRPNVCAFRPAFEPECNTHACALSGGSGATLQPVGAPIGLSGRRIALEVCRATGLPISDADVRVIINQPSRTFQPPPVIPIVPAITVCTQQVRSQGWCDRSAAAPNMAINVDFCIDHNTETMGTCGIAAADGTPESNCVCGSPANPSCVSPGCLACVNSTSGARCHAGTNTSEVEQDFSGTSTANDCIDLNTVAFTLLPPALCVDAMGNVVSATACAAPGSPNAACNMVGGVFCADSRGPDAVACTQDDLVPAAAPTTVPFTTKLATSTIEDYLGVEGNCVLGLTPGKNCATDGDCPLGTCGGATLGCTTGPNPEDCQYTAGPGAGISAANIESSNLAGWTIVGSFPALDGGGGLGDTILTFTLACS